MVMLSTLKNISADLAGSDYMEKIYVFIQWSKIPFCDSFSQLHIFLNKHLVFSLTQKN